MKGEKTICDMEEDENDDVGEEYVNVDSVEDIESLDQKGLGPIQGTYHTHLCEHSLHHLW
jgi:hypothetical protein